jgi:hypothetical protein
LATLSPLAASKRPRLLIQARGAAYDLGAVGTGGDDGQCRPRDGRDRRNPCELVGRKRRTPTTPRDLGAGEDRTPQLPGACVDCGRAGATTPGTCGLGRIGATNPRDLRGLRRPGAITPGACMDRGGLEPQLPGLARTAFLDPLTPLWPCIRGSQERGWGSVSRETDCALTGAAGEARVAMAPGANGVGA